MTAEVQHHLPQVRQMQTMSFVAHIPLVCFASCLLGVGRRRVPGGG
jgi:hypothetical protein